MNVLLICDRLTTTTQLRFALSASNHQCSITEIPLASTGERDLRRVAAESDVILLAMSADVEHSLQNLTLLRQCSTARIAAVGLAETPQQLLQTLHAGADAFIDEGDDLASQIETELSRVVLQLHEKLPAPDGFLIAVTGAVGGAGATMTAANLAVVLAQQGQPCGLIDLSGGFGELATLLGLQPRHTLSDLCANSESLDLEMLKNSVTEHTSGVQMIASGAVASEWEFDASQAVERVVETSCRMLPTVVLDLNRRAPYSQHLLAKCDLVVLMTNLDFRAACSTQRLLDVWHEHGIVSERLVLVANQCDRKGELALSMVESILGRRIDCRIADDPLTAHSSVNCGNPAVLELPNATLSTDIQELIRIVLQRLNEGGMAAEGETIQRKWNAQSVVSQLKRVAAGFI